MAMIAFHPKCALDEKGRQRAVTELELYTTLAAYKAINLGMDPGFVGKHLVRLALVAGAQGAERLLEVFEDVKADGDLPEGFTYPPLEAPGRAGGRGIALMMIKALEELKKAAEAVGGHVKAIVHGADENCGDPECPIHGKGAKADDQSNAVVVKDLGGAVELLKKFTPPAGGKAN